VAGPGISGPGILGAVLAGGRSSRFGSDKALAEIDGHTLLALAVDALAGWCEHVVVVGRETAPAPTLPDWPHPDMGPLGGLAAALHLARDEGYEAVLSYGVDCVGLPDDLVERLSPGPSYVEGLPVVGLWPAGATTALDALLESESSHSVRAFAEALGARAVALPRRPANINTPADLAGITRRPSG
jgi:molybdenum cofactor guanylyltransferase